MSFARYLAGGIGLYLVALTGAVTYSYMTRSDEFVTDRQNERDRDEQEWRTAQAEALTECASLNRVSLKCQHDAQARGVQREQSIAQCEPSITAFQTCVDKKTKLQTRRGFMELKESQQAASTQ